MESSPSGLNSGDFFQLAQRMFRRCHNALRESESAKRSSTFQATRTGHSIGEVGMLADLWTNMGVSWVFLPTFQAKRLIFQRKGRPLKLDQEMDQPIPRVLVGFLMAVAFPN